MSIYDEKYDFYQLPVLENDPFSILTQDTVVESCGMPFEWLNEKLHLQRCIRLKSL